MEKQKPSITIIGAGIAGCFLAILLARRGYNVDIYERSSKDDIASSASKRSFNLTFYEYGIATLKKTELWDLIAPTLVRAEGSMTQVSQNPSVYRFNKADVPQYIVQRTLLIKMLIEQASKFSSVKFHFNTSLISINRYDKTMVVQNLVSKEYKTVACDVIFGADGVNSQVRMSLQQGHKSHHKQEYADWEYKQVSITQAQAEKLELREKIIYAWTRKYASFLAHPNMDGSFSALLILPKNSGKGFASLTSEEKIATFLSESFSDLSPLFTDMTKDILQNPISHFVTIYTDPWYYKDFMTVLGDAAHGFSPFYGQGMSAAFGDCMKLIELVDKHGNDWEKIFPLYQESRKKHTDALAGLSQEVMKLYMRHKKADYQAVMNKLESILYKVFPQIFPAPIFFKIANDPSFTKDYLDKQNRQKKINHFLGVTLAAHAITGVVSIQERLHNFLKKTK